MEIKGYTPYLNKCFSAVLQNAGFKRESMCITHTSVIYIFLYIIIKKDLPDVSYHLFPVQMLTSEPSQMGLVEQCQGSAEKVTLVSGSLSAASFYVKSLGAATLQFLRNV